MESIAGNVWRCLDAFSSLSTSLEAGKDTQLGEPHAPNISGISSSGVMNEWGRFKVWAGNIGAHKTGRSSLDYRLRDASHIRIQVVKLLDDLVESLNDANSIVSQQALPGDEQHGTRDLDYGSSDEDMPDDGDLARSLNEDAEGAELSQISSDISDILNCLFRLSVSIRNPAPHDQFRRSNQTDTSHHEPFDIKHVKEKFPTAPDYLVEQLGKEISRRRQFFKYREMRHQKLAHGLDGNAADNAGMSTVASYIPQHLKLATSNSSDTVGVLDEDTISQGVFSETSYATSMTNDKPRIPPLPPQADQGPFECPFCYMMISATTTRAWKRHVLSDLRPYICLYSGCRLSGQTFLRRHQWMQHEIQYHWRKWVCSLGCGEIYQSAALMKQHFLAIHPETALSGQLETLVNLSERPKDLKDLWQCPLCQEQFNAMKGYQRHVGRHQEDLALFALPQLEREDEDAEEEDKLARSDAARSQPKSLAEVDEESDGIFSADEEDEEDDNDIGTQLWDLQFPGADPPYPPRVLFRGVDPSPGQQNYSNEPILDPGKSDPDILGTKDSSPEPANAPQQTFTCDLCGRQFDQIHKLQHHRRYHERPHECTHPGCGKKFGTKTHLERHINDKHRKVKVFHCTEPTCAYSRAGGRSFPRKDNWRRHMINKHGQNPTTDPVPEPVDEPMTSI